MMNWSPPLPHPVGNHNLDLLLEPLVKTRMEKEGFVRADATAAGCLHVFWEKGSVPAK